MKLLALCGAPGAGKTEVQRYLSDRYDVKAVDDGHPLRDFAIRHLGLTPWHVNTQEGKASMVWLPGGKTMQVREALGELGNRIEELFGPDAIPEMALNWVKNDRSGIYVPPAYCFGSVRRSQGRVYKAAGATVVEIIRPGHKVIKEFDRYDPAYVDFSIFNTGTTDELYEQVEKTIVPKLFG